MNQNVRLTNQQNNSTVNQSDMTVCAGASEEIELGGDRALQPQGRPHRCSLQPNKGQHVVRVESSPFGCPCNGIPFGCRYSGIPSGCRYRGIPSECRYRTIPSGCRYKRDILWMPLLRDPIVSYASTGPSDLEALFYLYKMAALSGSSCLSCIMIKKLLSY